MQRGDVVRIRHMLDAGREALAFAERTSRGDLDSNRQLVLSLVKCLEIIGEAASRVSDEAREVHPHVPWQDMTAMRNRLIHAYFDIDLDIVWDTVTDELPELVRLLEEIHPS